MNDERIKQLMAQTPLPESLSVYTAMKQLQLEMELENSILREALERIAYQHGSPNEHIDYLAGIASEALQRAGGGE